jgi:O-antigen/teichoic acid export membrane protein
MMNPYTLIYLGAHLMPAIVGFFALILYTHLLTPAEYGVYVVGMGIAAIVSALFFTWVRMSVARFQARSPELDMRADAAAAYGLTAVVMAALLPIALFIFRPSIGIALIMASVFVALTNTAFDISMEFKRAQLNALRFATISLLRSLLGLTLGYTAIRFGGGGLGLLFGFGASFLIANLLSVQGSPLRALRNFAAPRLMQFIRYGMPFSLGALVIALHNALDRLSVAYLLGESAAGCYGLAADLPRQITNLFGNSVASALFPLTFRSMAEKGAAATSERLKEGAELLLALIAPAAVWLSLSANLVAGALLGPEFQTGVIALLPLLAVGRVCGAFNQFYLQVSFQLAERPILQVIHDASVLIINISLLLPLTFVFGLTGAAMAAVAAEALGIVIGLLLSRRAFPIPFNGWGMARVFACTAIMAVVTYAAKTVVPAQGLAALIAVAAAGGIAYAVAALLFDLAGIRTTITSSMALWTGRRFSLWSS